MENEKENEFIKSIYDRFKELSCFNIFINKNSQGIGKR